MWFYFGARLPVFIWPFGHGCNVEQVVSKSVDVKLMFYAAWHETDGAWYA